MSLEVTKEIERRGHEQLVIFNYPDVGLKAYIGIHSTVLGPALGGCRMRHYDSDDAAIEDALRLSEGMTYKSSLAGMDLGGGKSCIVADPAMKEGRRELFLKFAQCLNDLAGRYITAEDMGSSVADIEIIREVSKYAAGGDPANGGAGDPSPWTARGVFSAIKAGVERRFGSADLKERTVTVQGVGHVGRYLVELLVNAGAKVVVCDTHRGNVEETVNSFKVKAVSVDEIYDVECDIYSPCAIGQTVNPDTLQRLKCSIIAGAANNQLLNSSVYSIIQRRKMLYLPDFVINSGGVISVGAEYVPGGWSEEWVARKVGAIYDTTHRVMEESDRRGQFPEIVAIALAKERIANANSERV